MMHSLVCLLVEEQRDLMPFDSQETDLKKWFFSMMKLLGRGYEQA